MGEKTAMRPTTRFEALILSFWGGQGHKHNRNVHRYCVKLFDMRTDIITV